VLLTFIDQELNHLLSEYVSILLHVQNKIFNVLVLLNLLF
jgi:hypothetical protein